MRTTISIDDALLEQLKRQAGERGTTVSRLIEESVRLAEQRKRAVPSPEPFALVTFGRGGKFTHLDIDDTSALQEALDLERFGTAGS